MRERLERLLSLPLDEGRLLILTHDNPDPDSLASAAGIKYLLEHVRGMKPSAAYGGIIGRAENRAMFEMLHLPIAQLGEVRMEDYRYLALIDAQPFTGNSSIPEERDVDIVIDHHPLREATKRSRFFDVRPGLGASATIVTQYLRDAGLGIPSDLATALLYGIRSETQDLGREVSDADLEAYHYLFSIADPVTLAAIARPSLPRRYYSQLSAALDVMSAGGRVAFCRQGEVLDPDFVPEMADLALRMEGMLWSLATGTFEGRLYVSIRTNDEDANAGAVMQAILRGFGRGGGHGMRAGGNIELVDAATAQPDLEMELERRFLREIGMEDEALEPIRAPQAP
jgi:nanoRNase/pAp phosphatase (c-di-AMP/oligoRNAs hydrolase)